ADVLHLPRPALAEHGQDRAAVVVHVDPVADVAAVAVDRNGLAAHGVGQGQRDQLLGKLARAVVVAAAGDHRVHAEGVVRGPDQMLGSRLGGRVGAVRVVGGLLPEKGGVVLRQAAHDFVGGDQDEAAHAAGAGGVEQDLRTQDVGAEEGVGGGDAAVHVGLGREVHDRVRPGV